MFLLLIVLGFMYNVSHCTISKLFMMFYITKLDVILALSRNPNGQRILSSKSKVFSGDKGDGLSALATKKGTWAILNF